MDENVVLATCIICAILDHRENELGGVPADFVPAGAGLDPSDDGEEFLGLILERYMKVRDVSQGRRGTLTDISLLMFDLAKAGGVFQVSAKETAILVATRLLRYEGYVVRNSSVNWNKQIVLVDVAQPGAAEQYLQVLQNSWDRCNRCDLTAFDDSWNWGRGRGLIQ